jgi:hypothetical protein
MDNCTIDINGRITDSLIASHSNISSSDGKIHGKRFILGERTSIEL